MTSFPSRQFSGVATLCFAVSQFPKEKREPVTTSPSNMPRRGVQTKTFEFLSLIQNHLI